MTKLLKILLVVFLVLPGLVTIAQTGTDVVEFLYDNTGNRVLRHIIVIIPDDKDSPANGAFAENENKVKAREQQELLKAYWEKTLKIYPNPNGGQFTVEINSTEAAEKGKLYLHFPTGKLVYTKEPLESNMQMDISTLPNGTYILTIVLGDKKKTWKVIKQ